MTVATEHDIRESFSALDDDKLGFLDIDGLYLLYLGLGYPYMDKEDLMKQMWPEESDDIEHVTVEKVLAFLDNVRCYSQRGISSVENHYSSFCFPGD